MEQRVPVQQVPACASLDFERQGEAADEQSDTFEGTAFICGQLQQEHHHLEDGHDMSDVLVVDDGQVPFPI